jgi:histidinol-phosphate aminotransferase
MSRFFDLVSGPAREMAGYDPNPAPKPSSAPVPSRMIHLDSNENPFGPSPRAIEAMRSALTAAHYYPDDHCTELRQKLAEHYGLPPEQVLITAGSTGMLSLLCQTLLGPGLNAVTSAVSFVVYSMAVHATGAQLIETPTREHGFDLDAIRRAINEHTRLVFLANPNNPTGTMLEASAVDRFLAEVPGHVVVALDEAYCDFAAHFAGMRKVEYSHSLTNLRQGASVVVLRTFSKAHGLAGLRIGYGLGPAELLAYCARMRDTYSVSSMAQVAALASLDDHKHVSRAVINNAEQAKILQEGLSEAGFTVVPTAANFVYCELGEDASRFADRLRGEGVSVRPLGVWGAPQAIRVTIGAPAQNRSFLTAIRKVMRPA